MSQSDNKESAFRQNKGFSALSDLVNTLASKKLGKQGAIYGKLWASWPEIVGENLVDKTRPARIIQDRYKKKMVLHIDVDTAMATRMEYKKSLILEKIKMILGYSAIEEIRLHQKTFPDIETDEGSEPKVTPPEISLHAADSGALSLDLDEVVEDQALKEALLKLQKAINQN